MISFICVTTPNLTGRKRKRIKRGAVATCCSRSSGGRCSVFLRVGLPQHDALTQKEDCAPRCRSSSYRTKMFLYTLNRDCTYTSAYALLIYTYVYCLRAARLFR